MDTVPGSTAVAEHPTPSATTHAQALTAACNVYRRRLGVPGAHRAGEYLPLRDETSYAPRHSAPEAAR